MWRGPRPLFRVAFIVSGVNSLRLASLAVCFLILGMAPAAAQASPDTPWLIPPVDGPIIRAFDGPVGYSAGHRGVDFGGAPGTAVRSAASGVVTFAGRVGPLGAVTIDHGGGLETTYTSITGISVARGQEVTAGTWIGRIDRSHAGAEGGLHFGVKLEGAYVDPEDHLGPLDASSAIRLEPLGGRRDTDAEEVTCSPTLPSGPPNDNIAVAVAGIGSKTAGSVSADMYERGPELLGYSPHNIVTFSYSGTDGPGWHEPYEAGDTFIGIDAAASKLAGLLRKVARTHPGEAVDLIAHSQGGVVARAYLADIAGEWDPELPRVEHLVTFSSPHMGAPLSIVPAALHDSLVGRPALWALGGLTKLFGGAIPDPSSQSVRDLAPHSEVLDRLGRQDILYGTRALALGTGGDLVVPADRSALPEETSRWVDADGLNRHSSIVGGRESLLAAHAFLRGAPGCMEARTRVPLLGRVIGGAQWGLGTAATTTVP